MHLRPPSGRHVQRVTGLAVLVSLALPAAPIRDESFMRGVVVTCPRAGQIWGTERMSEAVQEIQGLGADWISIHPYAWVRSSGEIQLRPAAETGYLREAVRRMRQAGVKIFWKPHLGYWGSFEWRGSIEFADDEAAWQRFFSGYRAFIVDQARFAEEHAIELFSIGIEYERTVHREAEWRSIVAAVREVYSGRITYAANWDGLDRVPFWDAVDVIGVHAYYPLSDVVEPTREALVAGWERHLEGLREMSRATGRPVVFAEIGYNRRENAAREPWTYGSDDSDSNRALRRLLMEVALERIEREPCILGMFWWKWMPGSRHGRDFSLREDEAREALRDHWGADPTS